MEQQTGSVDELLVSSLATAEAVAKLLIEKGLITETEFMEKLAKEKATHQSLLQLMRKTSE